MSNETVRDEAASAGSVGVDVQKPTKPAARKPAAKKAPAKAAPAKKPAANGTAWVLRKAQVAVLKALTKAGRPLSRVQIAEKGQTDQAFLSTWIGSSDPAVRKANEAKRGVKGLLTLGYVKDQQMEGEPVTYSITAAGKSALAKATT
jgi:hypothetical protein